MAKKPIEVTSLKANTNPKTWAEAPLYWATIEYHRFWTSIDLPRLKVLSDAGGKMSPVLFRDITKEYRVSRNFKGIDEQNHNDDTAANEICNILNAAQPSFTESLSERLERAKEIIQGIRPYTAKASPKKKTQVTENKEESETEQSKTVDAASAVTKLIWFLKPKGWTVFDHYAAEGVGIRNYPAIDKMEYFYKALILENFEDLVEEMQNRIKEKSKMFAEIPAARILDTLFMARGERGAASDHGVALTAAYLSQLPPNIQSDLSAVADVLQEKYGQCSLVQKAQPKSRGKRWQRQKEKENKGSAA